MLPAGFAKIASMRFAFYQVSAQALMAHSHKSFVVLFASKKSEKLKLYATVCSLWSG
jgi:hypothetical protein